jgi:hypothetical protein
LQVKEIKNGRLAMIAIGGITHHYFLTGKGPIEFITQVSTVLLLIQFLFFFTLTSFTSGSDPQLQVLRRRRHPDWTLCLNAPT